ncbi:MAG: dihydrodipicolinate synthase family protein [Candidatus Dormibacteraeota bacterium]|uniref:Dihydrodipicolinate synthase family protein n=1 Tax=Candidatus Dormiibacter inghamiae TaxID=3127013 RepID=A0A934KHQ4_9BACT|nr:dihydrodipicolinate synthase family protein [Candidatus Dormibacteraeota bacterium]MBJ7604918.1 dihydrodipicolinate synthase family protein [Candidatus Dormibacteraeota bacterium]
MQPLRGVWNILATPFQPDGEIDERSLNRLLLGVIAAGVDGITVLGVAGEAQKLNQAERRRVLELTAAATSGRLPICCGVSQDGTRVAVEMAQEAAAAGAIAVMVAPPTFLQPGPALTAHLRNVGEEAGLTVVLQDYPPVNGVSLTPTQLAQLADAVPAIQTIKLEGLPTPQRVAETLALTGSSVTVLGGLSGNFLLDELRRGAAGTMNGFAFAEVLVGIWQAWRAGDVDTAASTYFRYLPLLATEAQPGISIAVRKHLLQLRGLIDHSLVRKPGPELHEGVQKDLADTVRRLGALDAFPITDLQEARR